jgi:hypothetical protein
MAWILNKSSMLTCFLCLDTYSMLHRSSLCSYALKIERNPSSTGESHLEKRRAELQHELDQFLANTPFVVDGLSYSLPVFDPNHNSVSAGGDEETDITDTSDDNYSDVDEDAADCGLPAGFCPEKAPLPLPSYLVKDKLSDPVIAALAEEELQLRKSYALEALHQLRLSLGLKSALFRKSIATAKSQKKKTRAWRSIRAVEAAVGLHAQEYRIVRQGLLRLQASPSAMVKFPPLMKEDMKMSRDVVEENRIGQRSEHVSWIWRVDGGVVDRQSALLTESKCFVLL